MKTVWKYSLPIEDCSELRMQKGAQILCVGFQGIPDLGVATAIQIWARVDTDAIQEKRKFRVYGTGHPMPDYPGEYIGTVQLAHGALVFHVFDDSEAQRY